MGYGIEVGDVYIAADGGHHGHIVTDTTTYDYCDDVVTTPFTEGQGVVAEGAGGRIDTFKLAMTRYYKPDIMPEWVPVTSISAYIEGLE